MRIGLNSPQALLAMVVRRRWWIIAPFVALTCVVFVLAKNLPKVFVSETLILVKPREVPANFVVDLIAGSVDERLKSIEQTVMSRTNLVAVVREFGDQLPEMQRLNMDGKVDQLRKAIKITFQSNTAASGLKSISYFRISYQNQSPVLAQKIASKLTLLFIEKDGATRESQVAGTRDFFARSLARVAEDLQASEARLKVMRAAKQFELPERLATNLRQLEILGQDARTVEEALGRNVTQRLSTEELLAATQAILVKPPTASPGPATVRSAPPGEDPKITDYRKIKLVYEQLAAVNPANYPDVRQAKAVLDNLRGRLSPEELVIAEMPPVNVAPPPDTLTVPGIPPGTEPNPRYQSLMSSLRDMETEHKILQDRKADIARQIATYSRRVEGTPQTEQELADVLRENADLQKQYADLKAKLSQAELSASLENEQKGSQFQVVDPANLPVNPSKPSKPLVTLGGTGLSLILSLVLAGVVDTARQRVWTQSEIETFWGVPVLVDIPEILTDMDLAASRRKKWVFTASAIGAAIVFSVCLYGVHLKHEFILRQLDPVLQQVIYK